MLPGERVKGGLYVYSRILIRSPFVQFLHRETYQDGWRTGDFNQGLDMIRDVLGRGVNSLHKDPLNKIRDPIRA